MNLKNYPGSKNGSGVYQNIINLFPKHDIYIEAFLGSGAIIKRKSPAILNLGFDLSGDIIKKYDAGQGFNFSVTDSISFIHLATPLINMIHDQLQKILIYCDPPYLMHTRRSNEKLYKFELSQDRHIFFLDAISKLNCYVVLSCYDNEIYKSKLSPWKTLQIPTQTRKGKAIETLYYNFSDTLLKHQYNFIGGTFRERAAKQGRIKRNINHILNLPQDEQYCIMDLLSKKIVMSSGK